MKAPVQVILLRALAFLACAFLLTTALYGPSDPLTPGAALPPALPPGGNGSAAPDNGTVPSPEGWQQLLGLLPEHTAEKVLMAWAFGQSHQTSIVALGLLTCLLAMLLAGRIRCMWGPGHRWAGVRTLHCCLRVGAKRGLAGAQPWAESCNWTILVSVLQGPGVW